MSKSAKESGRYRSLSNAKGAAGTPITPRRRVTAKLRDDRAVALQINETWPHSGLDKAWAQRQRALA